ncbi:enoyl-CoA hydratase/isomerase family protein [Paraburkholderia sacchari]|uniref:enoyl-CoA hydratase/isomerase family protein n=1 Tax=Paraburkholderia sacchari TaxID=159450 RepID=UPI0039A5F5B6
MELQTLTTTLDEGVLVITLNRPAKLNAWTYQLHTELHRSVSEATLAEDVDAIVLTATGKGFCAGADMSAVFGLTEQQKQQARADAKTHEWVGLVRRSKPMIAAVNGAAIGIGVTLILPMDQIITVPDAKFGLSFVKMGLVPEMAGSNMLQRRVGYGAASRILLTGDTLTAQEALEISLVDRVVDSDSLLGEAKDLARRMGRNPRTAAQETKRLLTENGMESDLGKVQQREVEALTRCYASAEHKEAVSAFMSKREPDFRSARQR